MRKHWIGHPPATDPIGGNVVVRGDEAVAACRKAGWRMEGPYVPVPDEQAIERAEGHVESILRPYSSVLSPEIVAEQIVAAVLAALEQQPE